MTRTARQPIHRQFAIALGMMIILVAAFAVNAFATQDEQIPTSATELRATGLAGERWDGLMEARDQRAVDAVRAINNQRLEIYRARAAAQGVPVQEVGKVFFAEIVQNVPAGTWLKDETGSWQQKPAPNAVEITSQ